MEAEVSVVPEVLFRELDIYLMTNIWRSLQEEQIGHQGLQKGRG